MTTGKKSLGLWMLTALVAGNMIGSGIFLLPASLANFGSISLCSWIFTAIGALFIALVFSRLGQFYPKEGGPYAYVREAFGDFMGFEVAYNYWIALWVGNAAMVTAFVSYLGVFIPEISKNPWLAFIIAISTVWGLTFINILGIRQAGKMQLVTTILKICPLVLIAIFGLFHIDFSHFKDFNTSGQSDLAAFSGAAALTLWAFIGVESASVPADVVENPRRNIPRATLYGLTIATVVYLFSNIAVMGIIPLESLRNSSAPYADAARIIFGNAGHYLIAFGAMISSFGALNGWILLHGQIPYAAAQDNLFPAPFKQLSKQNTPVVALVVSGLLISLLLLLTLSQNLVTQFTFIIRLATFATLIPYLLTSIGTILLHIRHPAAFEHKPLWPTVMIAALAFIYSFWAVIGAGAETVYYGALLLFSGIPLYAWMKYDHNKNLSAELSA